MSGGVQSEIRLDFTSVSPLSPAFKLENPLLGLNCLSQAPKIDFRASLRASAWLFERNRTSRSTCLGDFD